MISLLRAFVPFPEGVKILDAELVDAHHPPEALEGHRDMIGKQFVLDLKVKIEVITKSGEKQIKTVNVEMQTTSEPYFVDRILAYVCRVYSDQVKKGGQYSDLKRVYSLVFTTENLKIFKGISDYYHVCNIRRTTPPDVVMSEGLSFVFVELGKFDKDVEKLDTEREFWCYLLKHSKDMGPTESKSFMDQGGEDMTKAVQHLWNLSQDEVLREYTRAMEKKEMDKRSREQWIRDESLQEGLKKGKAEGRAEGKVDVALRMLEQNMDMSLIVELTGLPIEKLQQLKKS